MLHNNSLYHLDYYSDGVFSDIIHQIDEYFDNEKSDLELIINNEDIAFDAEECVLEFSFLNVISDVVSVTLFPYCEITDTAKAIIIIQGNTITNYNTNSLIDIIKNQLTHY